MLRSACALIAILAAVMALPAFAQDSERAGDEESMASDDSTSGSDESATSDEDEAEDESATKGEAEEEEAEPGEVDYHRAGPYLGLAGTWGIEEFDHDGHGIDVDDSIGINARAGYRFLGWLSAEAQGEYMFDFSVHGNNTNQDVAMWLAGGNLRLNLPTDLIQPYLLFGAGYIGIDVSGDDSDNKHGGFARAGGGVEFYPWEHVAIDAGLTYVAPFGGDSVDDFDFISVHWGLLYRF